MLGMRLVRWLLFGGFLIPGATAQPSPLNYDRDVRPILSENCFQCHGQDPKKRLAGLRLDEFPPSVLVPGKPEESKLYQRITAQQPARRMPPLASNHILSPEQIGTLKRWIEEGGQYTKHWAFIPPARPALPKVVDARWVKQPIDAFVLQTLEREHIKPSPAAAPETWLRRVYLDLTGLPPNPEELDAFNKAVKANGERAYETTVDRLLASPAYGERMAMDWLDVARYADTHGFNNDSERSMWRWRDWVIDSFNRNMPYNQFLTEQLAGDLLPHPTLDQRIATGFGRNHVINSEGGIIDEEYRVEYVTDRVRTLGMAWLGLTLECAHCHDHKFDPITQRDHYRFYAFFNNIAEMGEDGRVANAVPLMPAPTAEQQARMSTLKAAAAKLPSTFNTAPASLPGGAVTLCSSCVPGETATVKVSFSKKDPLTFSAFVQPSEKDTDVPLLSALDYSQNPAAASYGNGVEFRLVNGELEFRYSDRYPAYSLRVSSEGAALSPAHASRVTLVYLGSAEKGQAKVQPAWVRIFVDGRELPTRILNDDLAMPDPPPAKALAFRIGWNNGPHKAQYAGQLHAVQFWSRALTTAELTGHQDTAWEELLALKRSAPNVMVMQEMSTPRETHILVRGSYDAPGDRVEPGVPEDLLGAWPAGAPKNRLGLAQWLTKPDHPLTSRVVVNRFWQQFFGVGIVKTSDNFGMQGEWPSHPELLDWMARDFIDSGWNVKALVKRIVLSNTYRQDSSASPQLTARDPENRLLARGPRFRLPAEAIRDQALEISGLLKQHVGGPSVFPYQPPDLYKGIVVAANYPGTKWIESTGDDLYRRSLYTFWKRTVPHPTMNVLDAPDREVCIVKRSITNTPLQSLTLLNDPIFVEAARKLAERAIREGGASPDARLSYAFRLATGRLPDVTERKILHDTWQRMMTEYSRDEASAHALIGVGASTSDKSIPAGELAAYTAVANIILNMDETITKG
jgi:hypothetical protein